MSVVGFDLGNQACYIAVARQGGIEVITNDYSLHATPSCVQMDERERIIGVAARQKMLTKLKQTAANIKHLIGRHYDDPMVELERGWVPCEIVKTGDNYIGLKISNYLGEPRVFAPEQVLAMILLKLRKITEENGKALNMKVADCVIAVPSYLTDVQRRAFLDATKIAELNCLRLINETTAVALAYGIYKQDLPADTEKPKKVLFIDIGASQTQMSVVDYHKGKLVMRGTVYDQQLGGRNLDGKLREHFAAEFDAKYKIKTRSSPRAWFRLLDECEKLKKQMTANNTRLPIGVECFMDDKDVQGHMIRPDFEELCTPVWQQFSTLLTRLLTETKTSKSEIDCVEMVGGSSRVPMFKSVVAEVTGVEPTTTMNMDEAVVRGAAMQCAILSPTFRVREFSVQDVHPYNIQLCFPTGTNDTAEMDVFKPGEAFPFAKMLTFFRQEPFEIEARYTHATQIPTNEAHIGKWLIGGITPAADGSSRKVKVKVRVNPNGIFGVGSAAIIETVELEKELPMETVEGEAPPVPETKTSTESTNNDAADGGDDEPVDDPDKKAEEKADKKSTKKKTKTVSTDLPVGAEHVNSLDARKLDLFKQMEVEMRAKDQAQQDKADAKNFVEEYVYDMREKLSERYAKFVVEKDRESFSSLLNATEEWLYDEGEDEVAAVYQSKLTQLRGIGDPITERHRESETRPLAFEKMAHALQLVHKALLSYEEGEEKYAHIEAKDMEKVKKVVDEKQTWLDEHMGKTANRPLTEPPVVLTSQVLTETDNLTYATNPILNKSKPKPKVEVPPPVPEESKEAANGTAEETMDNGEGKADGDAPIVDDAVPDGMDVE